MTAAEILARAAERGLLPTNLGSAEIRENIAADIRRASLFLSRGTNLHFLGALANILDALAVGAMNDADARLALMEEARSLGYTPEGGFPGDPAVPPARRGSLQDLASTRRTQFVLDTQASIIFGEGQKAAGEDPQAAWAYPAWELIRVYERAVPRGMVMLQGVLVPKPEEGWEARFVEAGGELVQGRVIALKGDPVWARLGSSEIFDDALDIDHPPFAFNSGKRWRAVPRAECVALGLIRPDYDPPGFKKWRVAERTKIGAAKIPPDLIEAAKKELDAKIEKRAFSLADEIARANEAYLGGGK